MKMFDYEHAIEALSKAIADVPKANPATAFFLRGKSRGALRKYKDASEDLRRAVQLEPSNAEFRRVLREVLQQQKEQKERDRTLYSSMLELLMSASGSQTA